MKACLTPSQMPQVLNYNVGLQRLLAEGRAGVKKLLERAAVAKDPGNMTDAEKAVERVAERSPLALQCVVTVALCNLNKRFLMMESAAKSMYRNLFLCKKFV